MTHPAIEAAARALNDLSEDQWLKCDIETKQFARKHVLATILAFLDAVQKPSPGMVDAAYHEASMQGYWQAMLAALRAEVAGEASK